MKGPLEKRIQFQDHQPVIYIVSMVMNRECGPGFETWFGDMTEASRRPQTTSGGGRGENQA